MRDGFHFWILVEKQCVIVELLFTQQFKFMKNHRGFIGVGILIAILVGLAVLGGGVYFVMHQTPSQTGSENFDNVQTTNNPVQTTVNTPTQTTQNTEIKTTATIDKNSLTTSSSKPTITGTFSNTNGIEVIVTAGTLPLDGLMSAMVSQPIWSDRSDHGGGVVLNGTSAGTWSNTISTTLKNGTYRVGIYQDTLYYPQTDANMAKDSRRLLASGTLVVNATGSVSGIQIQLTGFTSKDQTSLPVVRYTISGQISGNTYIGLINKNSGVQIWGKEDGVSYPIIDLNALTAINGSPVNVPSGDYFLRLQDWRSGAMLAESATFHVAPGVTGN